MSTPLPRKRGFTLIEMAVSTAVFLIVVGAVMQIMTHSSRGYSSLRRFQENVQGAQFALNLMAKELRTSSVVSSTANSIQFYDYSQNRCIRYAVNGGVLTRAARSFTDPDPNESRANCETGGVGGGSALAIEITAQSFTVDASTPMPTPHVGRVTVALSIGERGEVATIQTTVALRDFNYIEI